MAKPILKLVLSPSRDIPFDRLVLSQSNVRRVKAGVSIGELAEDIVRRTLLQSLNVRPVLDGQGEETGVFEVPAGGRRYRALELLVKQKRLAKNAPVPCVVRTPAAEGATAEEDSLAENTFREQLHPLDQFKAMQALVEQGSDIDAVAARFMTTPAVVEQRLSLASVSPKLHEVYAEDGMTLGQLMAFTVSKDHARQEQTWELLANSWNNQPGTIRSRLTEKTVRATDRRVRFIGIDAYVAAGGAVMRDLFEDDNGGWLQDIGLLDQLVAEKLGAKGERIGAEGWKWVAVALDFAYGQFDGLREIEAVEVPITPDDQERLDALKAEGERLEAEYANASDMPANISARVDAIDEELAFLLDRPTVYDPIEMARAGAFVSLDHDGSLCIERGYVRPEDEPAVESGDPVGQGEAAEQVDGPQQPAGAAQGVLPTSGAVILPEGDDTDEDVARPLPERLVGELTAHRTIALRDAVARSPATAYLAVLHAMVLSVFHFASRESCLGLSIVRPSFPHQAAGMKDSASAAAVSARHEEWKRRLPKSDRDLWDALSLFDTGEQGALFAHCAAYAINALWEPDNGRISAHAVQRRLEHSHVLARAVGLDMVGAGWKPTVDTYLGRVTKPRILEAVTEAKGEQTAGLIDHLKKGDMAREAERLLDDAGWLPEPLRTPILNQPAQPGSGEGAGPGYGGAVDLPAFLEGKGEPDADADDMAPEHAIAAE
jgi:ParB family chromosome partitioning protein